MSWFKREKKICPLCSKQIGRGGMASHLKECMDVRWYNLPIVLVSHIDALSVKRLDKKVYGVWDMVTEDWVRDTNNIIDSRIFRGNAEKLLELIKVKSKFNDMVGGKG